MGPRYRDMEMCIRPRRPRTTLDTDSHSGPYYQVGTCLPPRPLPTRVCLQQHLDDHPSIVKWHWLDNECPDDILQADLAPTQ